jgi:signal transduction histidine kinase
LTDLVQAQQGTAGFALDAVFPGDGELATLCRAFDWSSTPLGPVSQWPQSLRTIVSIILSSRHPMFLWWGPELTQIYNDAYRPSLSDRHPRALGARGAEFWTDIWPAISPQIEQVMAGGPGTWHEDQYLPIERNGRMEDVYWTYGYSAVRDDDGNIFGTLVVCQETTQRIESERRSREVELLLAEQRENMLRAVFDQAPSFVSVLRGPSYTFELANDAYYQLIGHRDILSKPLLEALPELADQGIVDILDEVVRTGVSFVGRAMPVLLSRTSDAAPDERFVDFIFYPFTGVDGAREGVIVHGSDVTEQVLARREAQTLLAESERARADAEAARAEAQIANSAKVDFLRVMSHELRTPLNAISGYAALLEMGVHGKLNDAQRDDLQRIQMSQQHLLGLINEVLNFAKLETGSLQYEIERVQVADAVGFAVKLVEPQSRTKGVELVAYPVPSDLFAAADPERLRQILVNLLSNALKFTRRGGRVSVQTEDAGDAVKVLVSDTGIGIAADKLETIFQPFVQVQSDLTRAQEGTGLGLAISRELARGMGGDLTVESEPGRGSTFTLQLPVDRASQLDAQRV